MCVCGKIIIKKMAVKNTKLKREGYLARWLNFLWGKCKRCLEVQGGK